jgi:hypothetical protein
MLDINEIRKLYEEGHYKYKLPEEVTLKTLPLDYIFDEDLTVKRNREMVIHHNSLAEDQKRKKQAGQADLDRQLTNDVVEYIKENYDLTETQARLVEMFVYREHHSYMCDYFSYIDTFAEFADDIANFKEN